MEFTWVRSHETDTVMISLRFVGGINTAVSDRSLVVHQARIMKVRAHKDKREVHQDFEVQRFRMRR